MHPNRLVDRVVFHVTCDLGPAGILFPFFKAFKKTDRRRWCEETSRNQGLHRRICYLNTQLRKKQNKTPKQNIYFLKTPPLPFGCFCYSRPLSPEPRHKKGSPRLRSHFKMLLFISVVVHWVNEFNVTTEIEWLFNRPLVVICGKRVNGGVSFNCYRNIHRTRRQLCWMREANKKVFWWSAVSFEENKHWDISSHLKPCLGYSIHCLCVGPSHGSFRGFICWVFFN